MNLFTVCETELSICFRSNTYHTCVLSNWWSKCTITLYVHALIQVLVVISLQYNVITAMKSMCQSLVYVTLLVWLCIVFLIDIHVRVHNLRISHHPSRPRRGKYRSTHTPHVSQHYNFSGKASHCSSFQKNSAHFLFSFAFTEKKSHGLLSASFSRDFATAVNTWDNVPMCSYHARERENSFIGHIFQNYEEYLNFYWSAFVFSAL